MSENDDKSGQNRSENEPKSEPAVKSTKVEDLRTIEDQIMTQAEPHFSEGGVLARMYSDRPPDESVYAFVESVKEVAGMIQKEQRMKADPAYEKRLRTEASKRQR